MEKITLDMTYCYKGSMCCYVTLQKDPTIGTISVTTSFGELVAVCTSGHQVAKVLTKLDNEEYA